MRFIDADKLREWWLANGLNERVYDTNDFLDSIDEQETAVSVDMPIYNKEEIYPNCTVQIWSNTYTGQQSIGWWKNDE